MPVVDIARERSLYTDFADRSGPALQRDLSQLREQLSTGKRVNRPSDDPDAFAVARRMERLGDTYARHEDAIAAARPWVDRTQSALDQMGDLFSEAHEEGLRAANDARSAEDREAVAQRLESLRAEAVDGLNTQHDGEYLFAGNRTKQPPFDADGAPTAATYGEIGGARRRPAGPGRTMKVNVSGAELHQVSTAPDGTPRTLTGAFDDLIGAVRSGDTAAMQEALGRTETARDHVVDLGATAGATAERLTTAEEQLGAATINVEQRRSTAEDADYLETVTALQEKQTRLQAALKATASTLQTSLLDYLR